MLDDAELNHLIKMINQIVDNIAIGESDEIIAEKVADHMGRFWARPMKDKIIDYVVKGGELKTVAITAVGLLK